VTNYHLSWNRRILTQEKLYFLSLFFFSLSTSYNYCGVLLLDRMIEMVKINLLFIGEVTHSSLHVTSRMASKQNTKRATCHLHLMHLATCQCMKLSTLPLCNATFLSFSMDLCLVIKVALPITILDLSHHLSQFHSQSWAWITTWTFIIQITLLHGWKFDKHQTLPPSCLRLFRECWTPVLQNTHVSQEISTNFSQL